MIEPTKLADFVTPASFLATAAKATTAADVEGLLAKLPVVSEHDYSYHEDDPEAGWQAAKFHWIPVGRERGNAEREPASEILRAKPEGSEVRGVVKVTVTSHLKKTP